MYLSEIKKYSHNVIQNAPFDTVGSLYSKTQKRIVPIKDINEIPLLEKKGDITGVIINQELLDSISGDLGIIVTKTPIITSLKIYNEIEQNKLDTTFPTIIHKTARIHPTSVIDPEGVIIGQKSDIHAYAKIHKGVTIGNNVRIGPNTTIGFIPNPWRENWDILSNLVQGKVIIENNTHIHSNVTVERPYYLEVTRIGQNSHIDSQTIIKQGTNIGKSTLIAALVNIGSCVIIGDGCWIGPRSRITDGVEIGESCHITLGSYVKKSISSGMMVKDNWAIKKERIKGLIP